MKPPIASPDDRSNKARFATHKLRRQPHLLSLVVSLICCTTTRAADITWINTGNGNWSAASNWSPAQVPGANDSAYITNSGTYTVTINTAVSVSNLVVGGLSGTQTVSQVSNFTLNGTGSVSAQGAYLFGNGVLTGSGTLTLAGPLTWTGGTFGSAGSSLVVIAQGGLTLSTSGKTFSGGTLVNGGTGAWTGGQISSTGTALFSNAPSATFDFQANGGAFALSSGTPTFANAGTLRKTGGTGTTTISLICNNSGSVQVQTGLLSLTGGGTNSGQLTASSGATLSFGGSGSTHQLLGTSSVSGSGGVAIASGTTVNVQGQFAIDTLTNNASAVLNFISGGIVFATNYTMNGTLIGTDTLIVPGQFIWTGGTIGSAGSSIVVIANGGLTLSGSGKTFSGGTLVNSAAGVWTAGQISCTGTAIFSNAPGATLDLQANGNVILLNAGTPTLVNSGTLRKTGGTGTSTISLICNNSGTIQADTGTLSLTGAFIQSGGQTLLNGGNLNFAQIAQLRGGLLGGPGTITGSVSNNATVSPGASPGLLSITGNYTEGPNAHLQIELGGLIAGTNYDQLAIGGTATLAGTLDVSYFNGFDPTPGNVFTALVCNARSGGFSAITAPTNSVATIYTAKSVLIETGNASPVVQLELNPAQTACRTFIVKASATDADGTVTNLSLFLDANLLATFAGASAQATISHDFPGSVNFSAIATDNKGASGATNVTLNISALPLLVLDPIGFQTNRAFKLCMTGEVGTNYQMQASDDLSTTNWVALGTMQNTNGIWRFTDSTATNSNHRSYRALQLP